MNGKDITQKMLERYNDVFADIVNVLLFNGKRIVDEDALTDTPVHRTETLQSIGRTVKSI